MVKQAAWSGKLLLAALMVTVVTISTATAGEPPEKKLQATVVDEAGEPIEGAQLSFLQLNEELVTDEEGRVVVDVRERSEHTVLIEIEGRDAKFVELQLDPDRPGEELLVVGGELEDAAAEEMAMAEADAKQDREDEPEQLDSVTVRTTAASPLDNPVDYQPVETLDERDLQRRSANSYGQMLDGTPGVAARSFGAAPARPVIRGLGGERVLVLQNGERIGDVSSTAHDHHIAVDPLEADRVDVVRGPASLMYGSSALGGVVNIMDQRIPRDWDTGPFSRASLYGAMGQNTGAAAATAGYGFEDSALRARASHRRAGDLRTPDMTIPDTDIDGTTADVGASTRTDRGLFGMSLGMQDLNFGLPEAIDDPDESVQLQSRRFYAQTRAEQELDGFFEYLEWRLLANRYAHDEMEYDLDDTGAIVDEELELSYDVWAASTSVTARHGQWGAFDRGAVGTQLRFRDLAVGGEEALSPDAREGSAALFVFEEMPLSEMFRLQFGLRPELHLMEPRANDRFDAPAEARMAPTVSGSVGLHAALTDHIDMGSQIARAHRVPIIEELYSDAPHLGTGQYEIGDPDLENEIGYGADVFARWQSDRVQAQLSGFVNHIDNFIFLEPTGEDDGASGYPIYEYESADARLWGAELSTTFRPWRALELGATADFVRGQRLSPDLEDLPSVPPLRGRLEAGWNDRNVWSIARVRAAAAQTRTAPDESESDGYALFDLEAGFRLLSDDTGAHNFSFRLDNAFDTAYRDHLSRVGGDFSPMPGRSLHATYRWVY